MYSVSITSSHGSAHYLLDSSGRVVGGVGSGEAGNGERGETELLGEYFQVFFTENDRLRGAPEAILDLCRKNGVVEQNIDHYQAAGKSIPARLAIRCLHTTSSNHEPAEFIPRDLVGIASRLLDSAPQAVLGVNRQGGIVWSNASAARMFGYTQEELRQLKVEDLMPERARRVHQQHMDAFHQNPQPRPMGIGLDLMALRRDGTEFPVEISLSHVLGAEGALGIAFISDITERKRVESEWRASEAMHRRLFWESPQPMFVYDLASLRFLMVNRAATELYGYTDDEFARMTIRDIRPEEDIPALESAIPTFPASGSTGVWTNRRKDGTLITVESFGNTIQVGQSPARLVWLTDVTQRNALEKELISARDQYQSLAARVMQVQEDERKHLSREIHDSLGQELTGLRYLLRSATRRLGEQAAGLEPAVQTCENLLARLREIASHLRPPVLEHLNVAESVEWLVDQYAKRTPIVFEKDIPLDFANTTEEVKLTIFRICQETLTNVARHSQAGAVSVRVSLGENFEMRISDDGIGFDMDEAGTRSLGLLGMRERSEMIGGTLLVESTPGNGSTVVLRVPGSRFGNTYGSGNSLATPD